MCADAVNEHIRPALLSMALVEEFIVQVVLSGVACSWRELAHHLVPKEVGDVGPAARHRVAPLHRVVAKCRGRERTGAAAQEEREPVEQIAAVRVAHEVQPARSDAGERHVCGEVGVAAVMRTPFVGTEQAGGAALDARPAGTPVAGRQAVVAVRQQGAVGTVGTACLGPDVLC